MLVETGFGVHSREAIRLSRRGALHGTKATIGGIAPNSLSVPGRAVNPVNRPAYQL